MYKFERNELKPKNIELVFKEFYNEFRNLVHKVITNNYLFDIFEDMDGYEIKIPYLPSSEILKNSIIEKGEIENNFNVLIKSFKDHLALQLDEYSAGKLASFFHLNKQNFLDFSPIKMEDLIRSSFFVSVYNIIQKVELDINFKVLEDYFLTCYIKYYNEFYNEFLTLESKYINFTKTEKERSILSTEDSLDKLYFFQLETIKSLNKEQVNKIIKLIETKDIPYTIALLYHLGLFDYLHNVIRISKVSIFDLISKTLKVSGRIIKGNYYVLIPGSQENKDRYTSYLEKEIVLSDLESILKK
jgi:hypothetical protein|uniref:hypothetical protein n=1 Tax=Algoriphagus sp. TaxID=1872435 RepID=UPI0040471A0B